MPIAQFRALLTQLLSTPTTDSTPPPTTKAYAPLPELKAAPKAKAGTKAVKAAKPKTR